MSPEQEIDLRMAEPLPSDEVIRFKVAYPDSPRTYTYAAVKVVGLWYLTGIDGGTGQSWDSLIAWLKSKQADVISLHRAESWEDIL